MVQNTQLSKSDIRVLKLLQQDISLSNLEMAEKAGMSQSTLWRCINELQNSGAIRKRVALLDPDIIGVSVCVFLSVNLVSHDSTVRSDFETFVRQTPEIMECFSITGGFDYMLMVRSQTVQAFETFLMDQVLGHKSIQSASSQIALRQHKYSTELPL